MPSLAHYLQKFSRLRTDHTGGWTAATQGQAPHKPILLLTVLDLFAQGRVAANLIEITLELGELFAAYWLKVMPPERRGNLALPFFHLQSGDPLPTLPHFQKPKMEEECLSGTLDVFSSLKHSFPCSGREYAHTAEKMPIAERGGFEQRMKLLWTEEGDV